jgi:hypothetical protein
MQPVDSTSIKAIGYDRRSRELYVRFLESGHSYVYRGVEDDVLEGFLCADSKGNYFNREIKGEYPYYQV